MVEYRFDNDGVDVSSFEYHEHLAHAPHLEQGGPRERILCTSNMIQIVRMSYRLKSWIDYGCGDGGLLSVTEFDNKKGYDFLPANIEYAKKVGRPVEFKNFVDAEPEYSDLVTICECLEHLEDPHGFLCRVECKVIVATVPLGETPEQRCAEHKWGWAMEDFDKMFADAGFNKIANIGIPMAQLYVGVRP